MDANIADLLSNRGLAAATSVILSGHSAGGLVRCSSLSHAANPRNNHANPVILSGHSAGGLVRCSSLSQAANPLVRCSFLNSEFEFTLLLIPTIGLK
jgi:alpha-beta hydrolase superfamily lysophospholipase